MREGGGGGERVARGRARAGRRERAARGGGGECGECGGGADAGAGGGAREDGGVVRGEGAAWEKRERCGDARDGRMRLGEAPRGERGERGGSRVQRAGIVEAGRRAARRARGGELGGGGAPRWRLLGREGVSVQ